MIFGFTYAEIIVMIPAIIGVFSVIAKYTPNKSDDKLAQMLWDIFNSIGQNSGAANRMREKEDRDLHVK